ncbi:MAG: hypothetical protein KGJ90_06250 [Patescibacteria group bacterium]|nr:hypothetical protein [Patescibacteria group bacterium]
MDNQPKISCIPKGSYQVTRYNSPSKGEDFLLHDVPDRSMIELHVGNTVDNTEGCILVGRVYGILDGKRAVLHSIPTLQTLLAELPDTFMLDIE